MDNWRRSAAITAVIAAAVRRLGAQLRMRDTELDGGQRRLGGCVGWAPLLVHIAEHNHKAHIAMVWAIGTAVGYT